jgi:hypothetical protein
MKFSLTSALAAASCIGAAVAHNIQLRAHSRECFHEELHSGDKMTVTFQVGDREFGGSGNLDIDFFVRDLPRHGATCSTHRAYILFANIFFANTLLSFCRPFKS